MIEILTILLCQSPTLQCSKYDSFVVVAVALVVLVIVVVVVVVVVVVAMFILVLLFNIKQP